MKPKFYLYYLVAIYLLTAGSTTLYMFLVEKTKTKDFSIISKKSSRFKVDLVYIYLDKNFKSQEILFEIEKEKCKKKNFYLII